MYLDGLAIDGIARLRAVWLARAGSLCMGLAISGRSSLLVASSHVLLSD